VTTAQLLQENPTLLIAIVVVLGLLVGSFLNVVIHRLPIIMERDWRRQCEDLDAVRADVSAISPAAGVESTRRDETTELAVQYAQAVTGTVTQVHSTFATEPAAEPTFNLLTPRSRCPKCRATIHAWQNIPVISYLLLRGRCAGCGAHISLRYPLVELLSGILSGLVAWRFGLSWELTAALLFTWSLIALSGIDIDHQLLPDSITLPLLWLGLLVSLGSHPQTGLSFPVDPRSSIIGAAAGYLSLWSVFHVFRMLTGKEGMGYGDFKLFAAFGAWFGWQVLLLIILVAAATGAVVGIALVLLKRHGRDIPIPFGPYLAAAGWIALMWGPELIERYLHLSGLH
jgi:leader peptidase (prepilin peptidase)/N-methyltransferase